VALTKYTKLNFRQAASILDSRSRFKLVLVVIIQMALSIFDLLGVIVIGGLGALSIQGIESHSAGNKVSTLLRFLHLQTSTLKIQVAILGLSAAIILILKTLMSIFFVRRIFYFLSYKASEISADIISKVLSQNLISLQMRTTQEILYIVSDGVKSLMIGFLATGLNLASDVVMISIMLFGLFFIDPTVAITTILLFTFIGYILHRLLQVRARELGLLTSQLTVRSNEKILEVLNSYRESIVRNRRAFYSEQIRKLRYELGEFSAEQSFQPYISKYVIESTVVLGILGLAGFEFSTKNSVHAVAILAVFLAAASRIAPAALRIQQGFMTMKSSAGSAECTIALLTELETIKISINQSGDPTFSHDGFNPNIVVESVKFQYPNSKTFFLDNINLEIASGSSVAIVGPSGAGKTTLIDLILGVIDPKEGSVKISNVSPLEASMNWSGAVSYVPQNIAILRGSIRENVGMGYGFDVATDERVWAALDLAQMRSAIMELPMGLDTFIGEGGSRLSGGQRQRLGIARALFTTPKLLVLDEATSALDGQTEASISDAIAKLSGKVTIIIVAHRLSTVRSVDKLIYMDHGKILAQGTFEEVRSLVPDFDQQAHLMGL